MSNLNKIIQALDAANATLDQASHDTLTQLIVVCQESLRLASKVLGTLTTPRSLGFNSFQMEFFRMLTQAQGKSVTKLQLRSVWGPNDRYTEHIFLNTLQTVRNNLRDRGIIVKGWEPKTWRIIEGLPIAQTLLAQIDDTWRAQNAPLGEPAKAIIASVSEETPTETVASVDFTADEVNDETPWT